MNVLIIGESCKDVFHYGDTDRLCPEAPVPVFNSLESVENGGMARNVFSNVKAMGAEPTLKTNTNWELIVKTRFVDKRTNHMFLRLDENDVGYGTADLSGIDFSEYDAVIVSDYNKGFLSEEDLQHIAQAHPLTFLDTKKILGPWSTNYSFVKINNVEYKKSQHTIDDKARENLIITQGPKGCLYRDELYTVPLVEVKDTSGAGDTFISGLCVKYLTTGNPAEAIHYANQCATEVVQKKGVAIV
jgi:D-beta-D-heptose 7-phosphate kinase/D-beta-D-heptose 1-phosphate adenosyltransferase